ncbi:hypothetical protein N7522_008786 [Penicillium canescens]|uniref:Uncharacterized protein n=2 Tax=Penicillium canescens TaxID=5083 RepID=A0AAD6N997_PENCN|nr:hypothetical protein N7522_008786 [Penicillium canescens]KAJ6044053.1 hypothetical protein N7460_005408 [Penicillium canescens]
MFIQKFLPVLLITMASLPSALAGSCTVKADVNESQRGAIQDVTVTTGDGSELIFDKSDGICGPATFWTGDDGDLKGDATLASPIAWDASCNLGAITS